MRNFPAIARLRMGIVALCVIFLIGFVGYQIAGWSPIEAAYMTVLILSTVGLETVHPLGQGLMLFSTVLTAVGVFAVLYIMGVFVQMTTEGELNRALGIQKLTRSVQKLSGHVIICGFGRMGEVLAEQLQRQRLSFVFIEKDPERVAEATAQNHLVIADDATEERTLEMAGIERAESLVTSLPVDADNVFITLTARELNPDLRIVARAQVPSTEKKLKQAGANHVVLPAAAGAYRMARMITHPSMMELVELVSGRLISEVDVEEMRIPESSPLVGKTVGEVDIRRAHNLLVVAVRHLDEKPIFAPGPDLRFMAEDTLSVIGPLASIRQFRELHGV